MISEICHWICLNIIIIIIMIIMIMIIIIIMIMIIIIIIIIIIITRRYIITRSKVLWFSAIKTFFKMMDSLLIHFFFSSFSLLFLDSSPHSLESFLDTHTAQKQITK